MPGPPMAGGPMPDADFGDEGEGAGGANKNAGGEDQGQMAPEYKSVETVRRDFPEAWIWSEWKIRGYAARSIRPTARLHDQTLNRP